MADIELLKRLAEAAYEAAPFPDMKKLGAAHRKFYAKAGPEVVLALIAENEALTKNADCLDRLVVANKALADSFQAERDQLAERLRMFELIHGGRAIELYHEISALRAEVRRLKIAAGEPVPPLPKEFVGPLPERPYSRLRRRLQEQQKPAGGAGAAENCRCNEKVQELQAALERARADAERYRWLRDAENEVAITFGAHMWEDLSDEHMDAAVDAAMGKGGRADG